MILHVIIHGLSTWYHTPIHVQGYEENVIATIGKAVLSGLHYMHPLGFVHRPLQLCPCAGLRGKRDCHHRQGSSVWAALHAPQGIHPPGHQGGECAG